MVLATGQDIVFGSSGERRQKVAQHPPQLGAPSACCTELVYTRVIWVTKSSLSPCRARRCCSDDRQTKGGAVSVDEEPASIEEALEVVRRLTAENARLREQLASLQGPRPNGSAGVDVGDPRTEGVSSRSNPASKLALFQTLFRGRDDIYVLRWERDGRSG